MYEALAEVQFLQGLIFVYMSYFSITWTTEQ